MMESLSYLHHAVAYETAYESPEIEAGETRDSLPWKKWGAVVLGVSVGLLGLNQQALAGAGSLSLLQPGDRSTAVKAVQEKLNQLGYLNAQPTGYFGKLTQKAVTQLQKDRGVMADGIVGPTTHSLLQPQAVEPTLQAASTVLKTGDRGEAIRTLQHQLTRLGAYSGPISGYFGPQTQAAVRHFQQAQGLIVDGMVGEHTQTALNQAQPPRSDSATAPPPRPLPPLTQGSQGERVSRLEQRLRVLGYLQTSPDSNFDQQTKQAVMAFQQAQGLTSDGVVGKKTQGALDATFSPQQVKAVQKRLQTAGFYTGPIDGIWGKQTQAAVETAKEVYGVTARDVFRGSY
ncbi:peptidoglycan-binding protein [Spirulina sp. CS-785/01]|uniref:peptidoglycan-binding domain-containing protein n=1 Tax=Spirulina sp. CS-785/01 TaxID=3021716 RepID=UPI00232D275B|nr:peptidoglycan-binding protein [Spirulina sp. CS-785/01]MDB9313444.1 peptidoglycan-binding protein [Spirulina sp. CS-785/01]